MNKNTAGLMIDENVMNWLDDLLTGEQMRVLGALNNIVYVHRQEISVDRLTEDEDIAALSHSELEIILRHACPTHEYDTSVLSNEQLLLLAMDAQGIISYTLPQCGSPILEKRTFANGTTVSLLGGFSNRADIVMAVHHWECGMSNISLDAVTNSDERPGVSGMYLCYDEHKQVRYGHLFANAGDGWTFSEYYANGAGTSWLEAAEDEELEEDDLPISLLTNWLFIVPDRSPSVVKSSKGSNRMTDTQRIFLYLRSLSPHVKAELVAHFDGILDYKCPSSIEDIGRLTEHDWRMAGIAVAKEDEGFSSTDFWKNKNAWDCFVGVMDALSFDMETRAFDFQIDFSSEGDQDE